jgi:hypothetical protein
MERKLKRATGAWNTSRKVKKLGRGPRPIDISTSAAALSRFSAEAGEVRAQCALSLALLRVRVAGSFCRLLTAPNVHPRMGPHSGDRSVACPRTFCPQAGYGTENIHPNLRDLLVNRVEWGATLFLH